MRKLFLILSLMFTLVCSGQNEAIHMRQRAIILFNFTRQIAWPVPFETFQMAVLKDERVSQEIERLISRGKLVQGRPVELVRINTVEEVEDVHLIYVNQNSGVNMEDLLDKVKEKGILIVSENYPFNSSMINMVLVDGSFEFEFRQDRIEAENFKLTSFFKDVAITSANRWQALYEESTRSLEEERQKVAEQVSLIAAQEETIKTQSSNINAKSKELDSLQRAYEDLTAMNQQQQALYEARTTEIMQLEERFQRTQNEINDRQLQISRMDSILNARQNEIKDQEQFILQQSSKLQTQQKELNYQKNFTLLAIIIAALAFIAGFFVWKNYRQKQKSNLILEKKNREIAATSEELKLVNKEMEQFASLASHDLQAPLNTISGWLDLIEVDQLDDTGRQSIGFISQAAQRMRMLIRGLLEYSKLGTQIEFERVDCSLLLSEVLDNLAGAIKDQKAEVTVAPLPTIEGHSLKLSMLFQNLISNALKFMKPGETPQITVEAKKVADGYQQISVKDNGIGIAKENQEKIFDIFHREQTQEKYEGTGIGLAHVRKIVELHKGKIWVESALGEGTTFHFTLKEG